jgi:hypothetical protein
MSHLEREPAWSVSFVEPWMVTRSVMGRRPSSRWFRHGKLQEIVEVSGGLSPAVAQGLLFDPEPDVGPLGREARGAGCPRNATLC